MNGMHKTSDLQNLDDLKAAKKMTRQQIDASLERLEGTFSAMPMRLLGGTVTLVAGAVAKGIYNHLHQEKETPESYAAPSEPEPVNVAQTLKDVGEETAMFALSKLIEKLLGNR